MRLKTVWDNWRWRLIQRLAAKDAVMIRVMVLGSVTVLSPTRLLLGNCTVIAGPDSDEPLQEGAIHLPFSGVIIECGSQVELRNLTIVDDCLWGPMLSG